MARVDCKEAKVGGKLDFGRDFKAIRNPGEKKRGRLRSKASCHSFREFIGTMHMEKVVFHDRQWT